MEMQCLEKKYIAKNNTTKIIKNNEDQFRQRTLAVMFIVTKTTWQSSDFWPSVGKKQLKYWEHM